jgi:DNA phosphorothioation-associated putative methyltransferase
MAQDDLARRIKRFPAGKRVRNSLYIRLECIAIYDTDLALVVEKLRRRYSIGSHFNVLKADGGGLRISFLEYADFFTDPHPRLVESMTIDLAKDKVGRRYYANSKNPPILHRKETLVGPKHVSYPSWKAMTEEEESAGLYENPETIGFKANWDFLLSQKGLAYNGHKLIRTGPEKDSVHNKRVPEVHRHKTAIKRYGLSRPIQTVLEYGLLTQGQSLLDYGCGKGDDVKQLKALGHNAYGWDPILPSDGSRMPADIVNLGFVLNVIEDPIERTAVLHEAYELSKKLLVISTLIATSSTPMMGRPYKDGILTSRNTFQKYFRQDELDRYIEDVLDTSAVAAGLGIFYVFRSPSDQQEFLANRNKRTINWVDISRRIRPPKVERPRQRRPGIYERNAELLDSFWSRMLELGRVPTKNEFDRYDDLRKEVGSTNKAKGLFVQRFGEETLSSAFELRRNDLQVYLALSNFRKQVPFKDLPDKLRIDIKTFLGGYKAAVEESQLLLFSAGNPEVITKLCEDTAFGFLDQQALYIHGSLVQELHPVLRIYVGCAEVLYGDLRDVDIIKIHKRSGKVSLLKYDDFEGKPLPELQERIKVNLRRQSIGVFDHRSVDKQEMLYFKERYVAKDHPKRAMWEEFSKRLHDTGLDLSTGYGPSKQELLSLLASKGAQSILKKQSTLHSHLPLRSD